MEDKISRKKFKSEADSKNVLKEVKVKKCAKELDSKSDFHINEYDSVYEPTSTSYSSDTHTSNQPSITIDHIKTEMSDLDEDGVCKENFINDWKPNVCSFSNKKTLLNRFKDLDTDVDTPNDHFEASTGIHIQPFTYTILPGLKDNRELRPHRKGGRRASTNCRERVRQQNVNEAFQELRAKVPTDPPDKKLSKCTILTRAIEYIRVLDKVLKYQEREERKLFKQCEINGHCSFVNNTYVTPISDKIYKSSENSPIIINGEMNGTSVDQKTKRKPFKNSLEKKSFTKSDERAEVESKSRFNYDLYSSIERSSPSTLSSPSDTE